MSRYCVAVARRIGLDENTIENILYAAPMHDLGKIGIPDHVLLKQGKLDSAEWEIMRKHTIIGAEILKGSDAEFIKLGETIAHYHHEKWDGKDKNRLALGLVVLKDIIKNGNEYSGGTILDPNNGKIYKCTIELLDNGEMIKLRGYIGFSFLGRTQYWHRTK